MNKRMPEMDRRFKGTKCVHVDNFTDQFLLDKHSSEKIGKNFVQLFRLEWFTDKTFFSMLSTFFISFGQGTNGNCEDRRFCIRRI